jgi:(S)-sulfolactate dehydrogenase
MMPTAVMPRGVEHEILITEFMDEEAVAALRAEATVRSDVRLGERERRDELLALVAGIDGLIVRNRTQVDEELLARAPRLRVVGRLGVGLDNIDVAACRARGIAVIPATGANALAVAEYVIGMAMLLLRGAYGATAEVGAGKWPRAALSNGRETAGKTLGIVGFGGIGRLVARLAQGLGMRVVAVDPLLPPEDPAWSASGAAQRTLDQLLVESDAVTLHVPLVPETRHLINAGRLAAMRPGAVLINTARGGVVDEPALAEALRAGRLAGAALDVFEHEPLPAGSALAGVPNLWLTPHVAGVTVESNRRVSALIAEKVIEALRSVP